MTEQSSFSYIKKIFFDFQNKGFGIPLGQLADSINNLYIKLQKRASYNVGQDFQKTVNAVKAGIDAYQVNSSKKHQH